jgi:predicted small secreted protein
MMKRTVLAILIVLVLSVPIACTPTDRTNTSDINGLGGGRPSFGKSSVSLHGGGSDLGFRVGGFATEDLENSRILRSQLEAISGIEKVKVAIYADDIFIGVDTNGDEVLFQDIHHQVNQQLKGYRIHITSNPAMFNWIGNGE